MKILVRIAILAALAAALAGCQADKQLSWDYGRAYHTVFENQKLDPHAGDDSPVVGMDGEKALSAEDRYEKAAPDEKKQNVGAFEAFLRQK